jgi:hypothetical protein
MKTFKYIAAGLLVSGIFAVNSFASITVHNKLKNEVIIRTDGLLQADKDAERADMILYIQPKQKITFELWKNPYNQKRNIVEDKLNTYIDWPSAPWKIVFLDGTISKSSSDKMNGNDLINDKSYEITQDKEGYVFTEISINEPKVSEPVKVDQDKTVVASTSVTQARSEGDKDTTAKPIGPKVKSLQWMIKNKKRLSPATRRTVDMLLKRVPTEMQKRPVDYFNGLNSLSILNENISDISPLSGMPGMLSLEIEKTLLEDTTTLASLKNLIELRLQKNQIKNIKSLADLNKLILLSITDNQIEDISPLSGLPIVYLSIFNNPIKNFKPLTQLKQLKQLAVDEDQLKQMKMQGIILPGVNILKSSDIKYINE